MAAWLLHSLTLLQFIPKVREAFSINHGIDTQIVIIQFVIATNSLTPAFDHRGMQTSQSFAMSVCLSLTFSRGYINSLLILSIHPFLCIPLLHCTSTVPCIMSYSYRVFHGARHYQTKLGLPHFRVVSRVSWLPF